MFSLQLNYIIVKCKNMTAKTYNAQFWINCSFDQSLFIRQRVYCPGLLFWDTQALGFGYTVHQHHCPSEILPSKSEFTSQNHVDGSLGFGQHLLILFSITSPSYISLLGCSEAVQIGTLTSFSLQDLAGKL